MENKSEIALVIGQRLRARRQQLKYSQDYTSEKAELHPTYIGQLERGEKNATIGSIEKVCQALNYPMEELFANIVTGTKSNSIAQSCYDMINELPEKEQKHIQTILKEIIALGK